MVSEMLNLWVLCVFWFAFPVSANVLLIAKNLTLSFEDIEANFAPSVQESATCGKLHVAEPLNACSVLSNKVVTKSNDTGYSSLLIIRGGCSFEDKVRRAQAAGFEAAIVYDDQDGNLIAMAGNSGGIRIYAVFVSKAAGEALTKYSQVDGAELWIVPEFGDSAWSIMAMSFISLLAMSAVLATCFFVQRHRIRREQPRTPYIREFHGMSKRLVKAMPSLTFTSALEDNCTSRTCAICLEDYSVGDKIRILPCRHKFHCSCVDAWLTSWRTFCPVCKRDARTNTGQPEATESTPLLSSGAASVSSYNYSVLSSMRSPLAVMDISPSSYQSVAHNPQTSLLSHHHSSASRSWVDLRNMSSQRSNSAYLVSHHSSGSPWLLSSQRSNSAYLVSPHSSGSPWLSSFYSRCISQCIIPGSNSSYVGASGHAGSPLQNSESAASFSPFTSAHSLP